MRIPPPPQKAKAPDFVRKLLILSTSLMLFAVSTDHARAQDPADELVTALDPLLQALINSNIVDALDVPANPTPQDIADLVNQGMTDVIAFLNGGPIPPGANPNQFLTDLENILGGGATSIDNLITFLDNNVIPGDGGELLDPLRGVLGDVFELLLTVDDDVVLPAPVDQLSLDELIVALQSILDNAALQTTLESLLTTVLQNAGLDLPTIGGLITTGITNLVNQITTTTSDTISFVADPPPSGPPENTVERPDVIAGKRGKTKGNDIYNNGGGQVFRGKHSARRFRGTVKHVFRLENDGLVTSEFFSSGKTRNRFLRIKFFNGGSNVTGGVSSGIQSNTVEAGKNTKFLVKTKAKTRLRSNSSRRLFKRASIRIPLRSSAPDGDANEADRAILRLKTKG